MVGGLFLCFDFHSIPWHFEAKHGDAITDEHINFSLASAITHHFFWCVCVYQVCPIKQDKTVGGFGSKEEQVGGRTRGMEGVGLRSKREKKRG